jgi:hypothetical protein
MKYISLILLVHFLLSCEKEIEYKGEGKQPLLVLDAILENHKPPTIYLTRSVFFLSNNTDASSKEIAGANVILTNLDKNESYTLVNTPSTGYYLGDVPIEPNTNYKIEVSYPKFQTITSQLKTVKDIILEDIDTSSTNIQNQFNYTMREYTVNAKFKDEPNSNFYAINLKSYGKKDFYNEDSIYLRSDTTYNNHFTFSSEPSLVFSHSSNLFFTDLYFQNTFKNFIVKFNINEQAETDYMTGEYSIYKVLKLNTSLISMTEDTYLYFQSMRNNQGGSPFSDPSNVHTNVKNGLGIFGSMSVDVKEK